MSGPIGAAVVRTLAGVLGTYVLTASMVALAALSLSVSSTLPRPEAVVLASMLGFLIYLGLLIWAFVERRLTRLLLVVVVGTAICLMAICGIQAFAVGS